MVGGRGGGEGRVKHVVHLSGSAMIDGYHAMLSHPVVYLLYVVGQDPCVCDVCRARGRPGCESALHSVYTSLHHCEHDVRYNDCSQDLCLVRDDNESQLALSECDTEYISGGESGDEIDDSVDALYHQSCLYFNYNVSMDSLLDSDMSESCTDDDVNEISVDTHGLYLCR